MDFISAIAVDFGSTNSGCARIISYDEDGKLKYDNPHLVHNTGTYAKDNTWFYIGKTGADWDSAPEQTGTLLMRQS